MTLPSLVSTSALLVWMGRYGYAAAALGVLLESAFLPVPGETIAVVAGFAAAHDRLSLALVIAAVAGGAVLGDNVGYLVGRRVGRHWLERHGQRVLISPARLTRMDAFFARYGPAAVTLARFVAGVRVVASLAAGASRMAWPTFLRYNVAGAVLWAATVCTAGYALGRGSTRLARHLGQLSVALALTVLLALGAAWAWRRARRDGAGH